MIVIPLEERTYKEEEHFRLDLVLDPEQVYEMAVLSISHEKLSSGIGTIHCNVVNATQVNQKQILHRFSKHDTWGQSCYYIIDTFNLRSISLRIEGVTAKSIAVTLALRVKNAEKTTTT
mgnify:CR=1 FL=1